MLASDDPSIYVTYRNFTLCSGRCEVSDALHWYNSKSKLRKSSSTFIMDSYSTGIIITYSCAARIEFDRKRCVMCRCVQ
jgi:hypothetical protein